MKRVVAALAVALGALVLLASPAGAHAQLESTSPAAGERLDAGPEVLEVRFTEGVEAEGDALRLFGAGGERLDLGRSERAEGGKVLSATSGELGDGGYVLTWRVVSLDGHPISGGVTWRVGDGAAVDPSLLEELLDAEGGDEAVSAVAAVVRALLFASLLVLVGALVCLLLVWPDGADDPRLVATTRASVAVGALTTVLGMGLQGADVAGRALSHAFTAGAVADTLDTTYGQAALLRLGALSVLAVLVWRMAPALVRGVRWRLAVQVAVVAVLASVALGGHARTGRWAGLAFPVDVAHLLAAAVWLGGLVVLAGVVLPRRDELTPRIAARFSTVATGAVAVVVLTGTFQAVRQVGSLDGLRDTNYGRLLALKVVGVLAIVGLGAFSRSLVRARVRAGDVAAELDDAEFDDPDLHRAVRRSVAAETVVAVIVVALTSLLVAADPARSVEAAAFEQVRLVETTQLTLVAAPARSGPVDIHLYVDDPNIGLTADLEATATMALPERGIPPIEIPIRYAGRGHWSAYDVEVPISGRWQVEVDVVVSELERRQASFTVAID